MKKLVKSSKVLFVFSLLLFLVVNFIPTDSSALVPGDEEEGKKKKQVKACICVSGSQLSSFANTCIEGEGACISNSCPSNTTQKCHED